MKSISKNSKRLRFLARKLINDHRGVAAIEFAMIVPIMLVLFFGTVEFSQGVAADRKVTLTARAMSDLVSQSISVSDNDLANFFAASGAIMTPYTPPTFNQTSVIVSELYVDPNTHKARVQWSKGYQGGTARAVGTQVTTVPTALLVDGTYLIFSEVGYLYQPTVAYGLMPNGGITLSDVAFTRPRQTVCVTYPTPTSGALPPCPTS